MEGKRKERETVEALIKLGAHVWYDYQEIDGQASVFDEQPSGPGWMRKLLGDNFFSRVVGVSLPSYPENAPTDAHLQAMRRLTQLQMLWLGSTYVTDDGLINLKGFTKLRELDMRQTKIGDDGLKNLEVLTQLQTLELWQTNVTDVGLAHLKGLTKLKTLVLNGTKVTDAGVKNLQMALPNCKIYH